VSQKDFLEEVWCLTEWVGLDEGLGTFQVKDQNRNAEWAIGRGRKRDKAVKPPCRGP
jgi:hypothetical protein